MPGACARCLCEVFFAEEKLALGKVWHKFCFSCKDCRKLLDSRTVTTDGGELFCRNCLVRKSASPTQKCTSPVNREDNSPQSTLEYSDSNLDYDFQCSCSICTDDCSPVFDKSGDILSNNKLLNEQSEGKRIRISGGSDDSKQIIKNRQEENRKKYIDVQHPTSVYSLPLNTLTPNPRFVNKNCQPQSTSLLPTTTTLENRCEDVHKALPRSPTSKSLRDYGHPQIEHNQPPLRGLQSFAKELSKLGTSYPPLPPNHTPTKPCTASRRKVSFNCDRYEPTACCTFDCENDGYSMMPDFGRQQGTSKGAEFGGCSVEGNKTSNKVHQQDLVTNNNNNKGYSSNEHPECRMRGGCGGCGGGGCGACQGYGGCAPTCSCAGTGCCGADECCLPATACAQKGGCCPPENCPPCCPKPVYCRSPVCGPNDPGCGGGGCCGGGCRGGCGKPGQVCLPKPPNIVPPCQPYPRGNISPCMPPKQCSMQPPCCRPARLPGGSSSPMPSPSQTQTPTPTATPTPTPMPSSPSPPLRGRSCCRAGSPVRVSGGGGCCLPDPCCDPCCTTKIPCDCLGGGLDCHRCCRKVYVAEMQLASGFAYHNICFSCYCCRKLLDKLTYEEQCGEIYCKQCYTRNFGPQGYGYGMGAGVLQTNT